MTGIDWNLRLICRVQGRIFEMSLRNRQSSPVFIRRFMNSHVAVRMDRKWFLNSSQSERQVLEEIEEEYGNSGFGKEKYSADELYWIGYVYRYWAYVYDMRSEEIFRICSGKQMRDLYYIYHSLDPEKAIERIMEARNYTPAVTREEKKERSRKLIEERIL